MLGWIIIGLILLNFIVTIFCLLKVSSDCDELAHKLLENEELMWQTKVPPEDENDIYAVYEDEEKEGL